MARVLLDACLLYPSVTRELLLGAARLGHFQPLWSERILGEWRYTARKYGVGAQAEIEIALLRVEWPTSEISENLALEASLTLPDADDCHVLAAAITGNAQELLTRNLKDFPTRVLAKYDIIRREPDGFLLEIGAELAEVVATVYGRARQMEKAPANCRSMLKKAGLPRLGKAFQEVEG